jgi:hypothetical protein
VNKNPLKRWSKLRKHPTQNALWHWAKRFAVVTAGRRSGKTELGKRKLIKEATRTETKFDINYYFAGAPTYGQARKIYWEDLKALSKPYWHKRPAEGLMTIYTRNRDIISETSVIGLDSPQRIEGSPWNGCVVDEYGNSKATAFDNNIYPALSERYGWSWLIGVPEGRNHYYDKALYACGNLLPVTIPQIGAFATNPDDPDWGFFNWWSEDILPDDIIQGARRLLDERTFNQEYRGDFVSYGGQLYYAFEDEVINDQVAKRNLNELLYLSCDFNKNPMAWVLGQIDNLEGRKRLKVVDQITIMDNAKTQHGALQLVKLLADHKYKHIVITGDASNNFESHRDWTTDYMIIKQTLQAHHWDARVNVPASNPNINNRVNVANSLFEHGRCYINSKCRLLKLDLERNESDNQGGKDKTDPMQTHASDAFDYLVWFLFASEFKILGVAQ